MGTTATNRQIVEELKSGDRRGCAHLLDAFQGRLVWEAEHVFCLLHEDSEEIVSDVLLSVVQKVHCFQFRRSDRDFHFWVMAVFRNRVRDFLRHTAVSKGLVEYFDEQRAEDDEQCSSTDREVAERVVRDYEESLRAEQNGGNRQEGGMMQRVADILECLQPWERVLLRCRALDIPYEEISGYTGRSAKQLKVYHGRVRKKFVRLFKEQFRKATA